MTSRAERVFGGTPELLLFCGNESLAALAQASSSMARTTATLLSVRLVQLSATLSLDDLIVCMEKTTCWYNPTTQMFNIQWVLAKPVLMPYAWFWRRFDVCIYTERKTVHVDDVLAFDPDSSEKCWYITKNAHVPTQTLKLRTAVRGHQLSVTASNNCHTPYTRQQWLDAEVSLSSVTYSFSCSKNASVDVVARLRCLMFVCIVVCAYLAAFLLPGQDMLLIMCTHMILIASACAFDLWYHKSDIYTVGALPCTYR